MAKRKRLGPADPGYLSGQAGLETKAMPGPLASAPIAQVAGEASARAALSELTEAVERARAEGRMLEALPLEAIDESHLVRDRLVQDEEEMEALVASIRARGQQTPIEVMRLPEPLGPRTHGLISGWRRMCALRRLHAETGEARFATVRALVIAPGSAADAYVAMVEENEIRVNLSHYERARIAVRAVKEGVYPDLREALRGLYGSTTRSRRSKIGSFALLVEALDAVLYHPAAIPEKLGLALSRALAETPALRPRLADRLREAPRETAEAELALLAAALEASKLEATGTTRAGSPGKTPAPARAPSGTPVRPRIRGLDRGPRERVLRPVAPGVQLAYTAYQSRIELTGPSVDEDLVEAIEEFFRARRKTRGEG